MLAEGRPGPRRRRRLGPQHTLLRAEGLPSSEEHCPLGRTGLTPEHAGRSARPDDRTHVRGASVLKVERREHQGAAGFSGKPCAPRPRSGRTVAGEKVGGRCHVVFQGRRWPGLPGAARWLLMVRVPFAPVPPPRLLPRGDPGGARCPVPLTSLGEHLLGPPGPPGRCPGTTVGCICAGFFAPGVRETRLWLYCGRKPQSVVSV